MKLPDRYVQKGKKTGGGMSRVILCTDERLDRDVIIKALAGSVDQGRLLDEIRALQSIHSGYVVQIFDVIADDAGNIVGIVEEYCPGDDLSSRLGTINENDFHRFGYQLVSGIAEIHECGVIHRDIKPNNVRVSDIERLTIIDFGLARSQGDDALTVNEIGTSGFMAPELFQSDEEGDIHFTAAIDVFAFGSTMYLLANGSLPREVRKRPPTLPCADLDFGALGMHLDAKLCASLNGCFAIDPGERPTAEELRTQFRRVLLHDQHRALVNIAGKADYLDASNRSVTVSAGNLGTVTIEYDGDYFIARSVSADVFVNNRKVDVGFVFPGCCVIALGAPELGSGRAYVTFDISHPGVEL
jgi:serine/threonine protein kinase